ncbi:MAG: rod shape-determining protein RodA [Flavobacteriales bacterium]|nr:rod shape-determining protein RodA [Flavobacteriales bacterium]
MSPTRTTTNISNVDWITVIIYGVMVLFGWMNIYAASFNPNEMNILNLEEESGKQFLFIIIAAVLALLVMYIEGNVFNQFAWIIYLACIFMLGLVLVIGHEVNGAKAWIQIGTFTLQPSEFAKMGTALLVAKYISTTKARFKTWRTRIVASCIIALPAGLVLIQPDVGSVLVFAGFILAMYREGLSGNILIVGLMAIVLSVVSIIASAASISYPFMGAGTGIYIVVIILFCIALLSLFFIRNFVVPRSRKLFTIITIAAGIGGIGFCLSVDYMMVNALKDHHRDRILVLFGLEEKALAIDQEKAQERAVAVEASTDKKKKDLGYNARMAKITVGSGGLLGKGYLDGPMTHNHYVPEQWTDFIFSAVSEEWGFVGSTLVLGMFIFLIIRLINMAERQRSQFSRVYGYCVASIFFMHVLINMGMVIGLAPIIGIPLPFFSYGGSSLLAFTILLFIMVRLDAERLAVFR